MKRRLQYPFHLVGNKIAEPYNKAYKARIMEAYADLLRQADEIGVKIHSVGIGVDTGYHAVCTDSATVEVCISAMDVPTSPEAVDVTRTYWELPFMPGGAMAGVDETVDGEEVSSKEQPGYIDDLLSEGTTFDSVFYRWLKDSVVYEFNRIVFNELVFKSE